MHSVNWFGPKVQVTEIEVRKTSASFGHNCFKHKIITKSLRKHTQGIQEMEVIGT